MTLIASHRGGALLWPENSPTAFRNTACLPVDQVEFDIHPTADGHIVVIHDATLDRTTSGTGPVHLRSLAELKALTLNGTDEAMLTLSELAAIFAPTAITLRMEVKTDPAHRPYPGLLADALEVLDGLAMRGRTVVTSFNLDIAAEAAATPGLAGAIWLVSPEVQTRIGLEAVKASALAHQIGRLGLRCSHLEADNLAELRAAGLGVGAWAVNDALAIADVLDLAVDVFTTDNPVQALLLRDGVRPMLGETVVPALTPVSAAARDAMRDLPPTRLAHTATHAGVAAFGEIEVGGSIATPHRGEVLRLGAWNIERVLYPEASADLLAANGIDLALLTELDCGCHRTGNRHTLRDMAGRLGQGYAYGLEFLELATMPQPFPLADTTDGNRCGFHGNGFLSALPFERPVVIRLDEVADWFVAPPGGQSRIGTRMAVAGTFVLAGRELVACAVHLESNSDVASRALQMRTLLAALERYAAGRPVVIAGDLNTKVMGSDEALFDMAVAWGYDWAGCNVPGRTTRTSTWTHGDWPFKLDWIATRGLTADQPKVIPAVSPDGKVLSDHELLTVTLRVP
jgi:glycerophosphoryl diester phosphodiesterase/endonuclease/exonuclease/phosphatase family metal-dependent hydrolase